MALINDRLGDIRCLVVYVGPALSGKTSNLAYVYQHAPLAARGEIFTVATEAEPTHPCDFLPLELGPVGAYQVHLYLYGVPGRLAGDRDRVALVRRADALVFVVDSSADRFPANVRSHDELTRILERCQADGLSIPMVVQFNKRDVPDAVPLPILKARLNPTGLPAFEAVATAGTGVFATLHAVSEQLISRIEHLASKHPEASVR